MLRRLLPLALLVVGCSGPTTVPPPPALPTLSSATLYYGPTAARIGWEGLPGTLRITGRDLADPIAPGASLRLTATRIRDLEGNVTAAPEITAVSKPKMRPPVAETTALRTTSAFMS